MLPIDDMMEQLRQAVAPVTKDRRWKRWRRRQRRARRMMLFCALCALGYAVTVLLWAIFLALIDGKWRLIGAYGLLCLAIILFAPHSWELHRLAVSLGLASVASSVTRLVLRMRERPADE